MQKVIANPIEHNAFFAVLHGCITLSLCVKRDLGDPLRVYNLKLMKDECWKVSADACDRDDFLKMLLRKLDYTGLGCLQYRYRDNDPVALDFNPRICASARRDGDKLARLLCAMQFEGRGVPGERTGCIDGGIVAAS